MTTVTLVLGRARNETKVRIWARDSTKCWRNGARAQSWNSTSKAGQKTESAQPDLPPALAAAETPSEPPRILLPHSTDASSAYTPPMKSAVPHFRGERLKGPIDTIAMVL